MAQSKDMVVAALNLSEEVTPESQAATKDKVKKIEEKLKEIEDTKGELFGIEAHAAIVIEDHADELKIEKEDLEATLTPVRKGYRLLSFEPLSWRDKNGFPRLVLFSLDHPMVRFRFSRSWSGGGMWESDSSRTSREMDPKLPPALREHYVDVFNALERRQGGQSGTTSISTEYNGIIPTEIRKKIIAEQKKGTWEKIFILAECKGWKLDQQITPRPGDPLVLGWDGSRLWVIDHYDLTPAEEYVKNEFSV